MEKQEILDIDNINEEFSKLNSRLDLLSDRFVAIALDYKVYIDGSFKESKIYRLRNEIQYRFFSTIFHVELLLRHHLSIQQNLEESINKINLSPADPYFEIFHKQLSSLFDSIIYHTVSVFDYLSTLINYISGEKKEDTIMWTQMAKSIRDDKNDFSKKTFSKTIDKIDNEFVAKLYDHRALIIHKKADIGGYSVTLYIGQGNINAIFLAGKNVIKSFRDLKDISKVKKLTINYVTFWILNRTIDYVTEILFSLKNEIMSNAKHTVPFMYYLDPKTNKQMPASVRYWHEDLYKKEKNK